MQGLMMNTPLTLTPLLERAARLFPKKEIVSKTDTGMHRYTYADFHGRVHRLAHAMRAHGRSTRRPSRNPVLEQLPASGTVFRRHLLRRRAPYSESAPGA